MNPRFRVLVTSRFERELKKLTVQHSTLPAFYRRAIGTLELDPYNRSREHAIKKLTAVPAGEGQYRLRVGRFRFRYDIQGQTVHLKACSLRREDTFG